MLPLVIIKMFCISLPEKWCVAMSKVDLPGLQMYKPQNMQTPVFSPSVERSILLLVGAVQFVNILDFMMVMPLGPDFATALNIPNAELGWVGGSYTAAAAVGGIIASTFVDRLDRKKALIACLWGLVLATALGGFAWSLESLLVARIAAGLFGGPATSLVWAIVADVVEPARRGQAMGKVMGAFSLASIFGVPFGLEVARLGDWRMPFFVTASMGAVVLVFLYKKMPSLRLHLEGGVPHVSFAHMMDIVSRPLHQIVFAYIAVAMAASFMVISNLSTYVQYNLHYPRDSIGTLYCIGGAVSLVTMRITGKLIDRFNATFTSIIGTVTYASILWATLICTNIMPVPVFFVMLMFALGMRNVSSTTLASKVPGPQERAGFMSIFSCLQSLGMASGAFLSAHLLAENPDKSLIGMDRIAVIAMTLSLCVPLMMRFVERRLKNPR